MLFILGSLCNGACEQPLGAEATCEMEFSCSPCDPAASAGWEFFNKTFFYLENADVLEATLFEETYRVCQNFNRERSLGCRMELKEADALGVTQWLEHRS